MGILGQDPAISIRSAAKIGILLSLAGGIALISRSQLVESSELLATAVAIDFIVTLPLVYFLLIRRSPIPWITVMPVFLLCVLAASVLVPAGGREFLGSVVTYAVPAVELFVFGYLGYRVFRTRRAFLDEKSAGRDLMERLRVAFERELKPPFVARAAAFELGVFIFAFIKWRRPKPPSANFEKFTYHRANGSVPLLGVLLFLLIAETIIVHILLAMWSPAAAWVATALSIYFAIQVFAHLKALMLRPIVLTDEQLLIRCGILGDAAIMLDHINRVDNASGGSDQVPSPATMTLIGQMSEPNVTINLSTDSELNGIYGMVRPIKTLSFSVDEPERFVVTVRRAISRL